MAEEIGMPEKGHNAGGQAVAAVALFTALGGGLWAFGETSSGNSGPPAATGSD
jgi:hypothetical protein